MSWKQQCIDLFYELFLSIDSKSHNRIFFRKINGSKQELLNSQGADETLVLLDFFLQDPNKVYMDVGANIGAFVYRALKQIKAEQIIAFEPLPDLNKSLSRKFSGIDLHAIALSDHQGTASFKIPIVGSKNLHTRATLNTDFVEEAETNSRLIEVVVDSLNNWAKTHQPTRIDLLKIDVEGHEENLLLGADQFLKQYRPVLIIEIEQRHHKQDIKQIIQQIVNLDYAVRYFKLDNLSLEDPIPILSSIQEAGKMKSSDYINNFVFIPNEQDPEAICRDFHSFMSS